MEKVNKEKLTILHIAEDPEFLSPIVNEDYLVQIETIDNLFAVSQWVYQNGMPDAILCESRFPGGNGFKFHDFWVAQFDAENRIPFILLEEVNHQPTGAKALDKKIDEVYTKPIDAETLIRRILILRKTKPQPHPAMISEMDGFKPYKFTFLKRTFDIVTASIFLLIASPLLLIFAIAIKLETRGTIFYRAKRVGSGFKVFDMFKLRSMYTHSDKRLKELTHLTEYNKSTSAIKGEKTYQGTHSMPLIESGNPITSHGDPRITKVGSLMRKLNIDELPQLFNVIKGDISMVGNRPLPIYEAELLTTDDWNDRFYSPAGITGIWKVVSRRKLRSMSHEQRNSLQNKYSQVARHPNSFWNDIWIIIQTIPTLFKKDHTQV